MQTDTFAGLPRKAVLLFLALPVIVTAMAFGSLMSTDVSDLAVGTPLVVTPTLTTPVPDSVSSAPAELEAAYAEGLEDYARGDFTAASRAFRYVIENAATPSATVYRSLGLALMQQGDAQGAIEAFSAAAALDPKSAGLLVDLGAALAAVERYNDAEAAFRSALERDPGTGSAAYGLAGVFLATGRPADAEDMLLKVIALDPKFAAAFLDLGLLYAQQERWSQAEDALESALNADPDSPEIQYNLGIVYAERGDERMARLVLSAVVSSDPGGEWGALAAEALSQLGTE